MGKRVLASILIVACLGLRLSAQVCLSWTSSTPSPTPGDLQDYPIAYDSDRQVVVARDGLCCGRSVWEWDGSTWTGRGAGGPPQSNGGMAMAYDAAHHYCLLVDRALGRGMGPLGLSAHRRRVRQGHTQAGSCSIPGAAESFYFVPLEGLRLENRKPGSGMAQTGRR
jgi:hypothetical protein